MGLQAYAAIVSTILAVTTLASFVVSFSTARSDNQRALRDQLRKQLREMKLACHMYFQREGWEAVNRGPQYSFQALDQIREDGLISPGSSHIARLKSILREISGRTELRLPKPPAMSKEQHDRLIGVNDRRLESAFESLEADAQRYLRALGMMDNAGLRGYWTYMRYRWVPARQYVN
ncbi:hypothetical protein [Mycobacterium marinum]|uniref:hypothetical protein n=1 Tax=Mycobacterium marinum TaxID=1781 RepID=UPI003561D956